MSQLNAQSGLPTENVHDRTTLASPALMSIIILFKEETCANQGKLHTLNRSFHPQPSLLPAFP